MTSQRTRRGRISYQSLEPDRLGVEHGRERFHMTFQADGKRTICESDNPPHVLRHVTMTYGADGRPTEAFVRIDLAGKYMGSAWFDLRERYATLEGRKAQGGRLSNRIDLDEPLAFIGCDPIVSDAWHMANYDLSSADAAGTTGPMLWALRTGMQFVGPETIEVAAGRFDALHFQIVDTAGQMEEEHPPYDIWTTADGDYIALRSEGSRKRYELMELHDGW